MYRRMLCSFYRPFTPQNSKSIHTNANYFLNLEAALATQFDTMLQACSDHSFIQQGRQVHSHAICTGLIENSLVAAKLLGMYFHCASVVDAKNVFYQLDLKYSFPWNCMIRGFSIMGRFEFALLFYFKMLAAGVSPDKYTFPSVIKACGGLNNVRLGKAVHDSMQFMGFEVDIYAGSSLLQLYVNNGCIHDARRLFDKMSHKDCVSWNVLLHGYVKKGELSNAVGIFMEMRSSEIKANAVTFSCILSVCASEAMISFGTQLHALVVAYGLESHFSVANTLIAVYSKCHCLSDARTLFDMMPRTDLVRWNGMISGYIQNGFMSEASHLFKEMISAGVKPDSITLASFLPSVAQPANLKQAKEIHGYIIRHCVPFDVYLKSALTDVYSKCRSVEMARNIFNQSTRTDVVMCTAMVSGLVLNGMNTDALEIFRWMLREKLRPNTLTMASVLPACAGLAALKLGKELHGNILKHGLDKSFHVGSALTGMYAKSGRLDLAHQVFQRLSERDAICWNSMLTSYSQNGKPEEAIDLFRQMGMGGVKYDCVSISAALSASANLPALHYGKEIHGFITKSEFSSDIFAESALIDMYAKCGNLVLARRVFDLMEEKNEVSWNSIISAYGYHGRLKDSLVLFRDMLDNGILPDHVTFLGVLSACVHAGQVDDGMLYFRCMTEEYGIPAWSEHYALMVDLLGRAGRLHEAFETIKSMPFSPGSGVWGTLLGACRVHGNIQLAEEASRHLFDLEPHNSGYYMLLANIYADAGQWENVRKVRNLMNERGVQKIPGYSWIEVNNKTHVFVAADRSHPQSAKLHSLLNILLLELRKEGYNPQFYLPMHPQTKGI
ncbi:putative tetratricopeptide-like helical domain-containing protein [Rosa chinensis]|uniref:Putative tetratricopeptide-like helical domain-containing protein n=1 Tax=Rosa chinensis TaxID=74649 RepID=A0A2P6PD98_ROSCH|nr:pentatricopeptide repeat-containing protein At4g21300 [Rosa chinensis]XP_040367850.1 pentatricopeptide repeat-containing protein At4g21300 [Rosa chinensis]XP_040367851.1 pentatricopeptide repeat-containing protein At4g21300 [Rosa chinensis]XP_040367852.1 pentatricopeptide repeat-containing protein At4g21300 [Rosa chinensis]XP_040367853.1 pentatricopeptide repeat-containing protein At4g21300 [Rosa chinensis]XP_040367854.1 pentatricopeptide repeat-containing protein At4g21300 [Rosa chinensis]